MSGFYEIALSLTSGIGAVTARSLIDHFGDAEAIFKANKTQLTAVQGIGIKIADSILKQQAFARAEKELAFAQRYKIDILTYTSDSYPARLRNCYDAPMVLYYKGTADLNSTKIVSIVGTRRATPYGKELTQSLVESLKQHDILVISGLAHGIDGIAHKACLKAGIPNIGVVGHGLDRIYPAQHRAIAEKMISNGGLLTEFTSETNPDRENFPKRNRIVAGMADATIIVEASLTGGALITAELANSYNRDVFAYPGRVKDEFSAGCNYLIKTHRANLMTSPNDLLYIMGWATDKLPEPVKQISLNLNLSADEQKIVDILKVKGSLAYDALSLQAGMPQSKLAITVLALEMQGIVVALPGKIYRLM